MNPCHAQGRHPDDRVSGHRGGSLIWKCAACGREEARAPVRYFAEEPAEVEPEMNPPRTVREILSGPMLQCDPHPSNPCPHGERFCVRCWP